MAARKTDIWLYAHWKGIGAPKCIGVNICTSLGGARPNVTPSYLEIAEFIQNYGSNIEEDLHQLWRRIVFHMAISNTDDHFRNHGFLLEEKGWRLSPAYDINPSIDKNGLALNVDMDNNALDFELAKSVGKFFQLNEDQMDKILDEIVLATAFRLVTG